MNRILVVDDQTLFSEGWRYALSGIADQVDVIWAKNSAEADEIATFRGDLDLVLLGLSMPVARSLDRLKQFSLTHPLLRVVVFSDWERYSDMKMAFEIGATGYISKRESGSALLEALNVVLGGGIYVPLPVTKNHGKRKGECRSPTAGQHRSSTSPSPVVRIPKEITPRQQEVLSYIEDGLTNKEISRKLLVTEATVKAHVSAILRAFNVSNRARVAKAVAEIRIFQ